MICSTFWNDLFIKKYKKITFVKPGERVDNVYAMYRIGHHYDGEIFDNSMNPTNFVNLPLQQTASDILGLPFSEIKPKIVCQPHTPDKLIGLGIQSTAQSKYWNNPTGWQEVVDWIKSIGYTPIILSREENGYMGNFYPSEVYQNPSGPLGNVISLLSRCSAFVGVSSGLSWLAWAVGVPVVQVSGITYSFNEPNSGFTKINTPNGLCSGCANRVKFDPGNWTWCPEHEHDSRIFECSREIPASDVISALSNLLQIDNIK
jgi:autotransporter strand-loop-strand O-heptosyltransferase